MPLRLLTVRPAAFGPLACTLVAALLGLGTTTSQATELRVATWNLGWHLDSAQTEAWIGRCSQPFVQSAATGQWAPAPAADPAPAGAPTGWTLKWGRNAPVQWDIGEWPPCDIYQDKGQTVPVTPAAYSTRQRQIASVLGGPVKADVVAFQEVSGARAVQEVLPAAGADHEVCSYSGHKVQRLAIAWHKRLGPALGCEVHWPLSLPQATARDQPRPGLALTLQVEGKRVRFLTLHLKSSCVSPLDDNRPDGRGQLDGAEPNCAVLQQQVAPLEAWVEAQSVGVDVLVLLGDFNRNLAHEQGEPAAALVRSDGAPTDAHRPGNKVRNLWREVNDGSPASSRLSLLEVACPGSEAITGLCVTAKTRRLSREENGQLGAADALGCRNPVGLDFIAVGGIATTGGARKVALGALGRTSAASDQRPQALLGLSDHCPLVADLAW